MHLNIFHRVQKYILNEYLNTKYQKKNLNTCPILFNIISKYIIYLVILPYTYKDCLEENIDRNII